MTYIQIQETITPMKIMSPPIVPEFQNVLGSPWNPTPLPSFTSCDLATMDLLPLTLGCFFKILHFNAISKVYHPFIVIAEY